MKLVPHAATFSKPHARLLCLGHKPEEAEEDPLHAEALPTTTGLHPSDVQKLVLQLHRLVDAGNTVIVVEHDMNMTA